MEMMQANSIDLTSIKKKNSIILSYIYAVSERKQKLSIYSERLLVLIVAAAQEALKGKKLKDCPTISPVEGLDGYVRMKIKARDLMPNKSHNFKAAFDAILELQSSIVVFKEGDTLKPRSIIVDPDVDMDPDGNISFILSKEIWENILDFSKGSRRISYEIASKLGTSTALRLYVLLAGQKKPLRFTVDEFQKIIGCSYDKSYDLKRRELLPAQKELNEKSPYTFDFEFQLSGEQKMIKIKGTQKPKLIIFTPKYQEPKETEDTVMETIRSRTAGRSYLTLMNPQIINYLKKKYDFSDKEIESNGKLFLKAEKIHGIQKFCELLNDRQEYILKQGNNRKGLLIYIIKDYCNDL